MVLLILLIIGVTPAEKIFGNFKVDSGTIEKVNQIYQEVVKKLQTRDTTEILNRFLDSLWENKETREIVFMPYESAGVLIGRGWAPPSHLGEFLLMSMKASNKFFLKERKKRHERYLMGIKNEVIRRHFQQYLEGYEKEPPETTVIEEWKGKAMEECSGFLPEIAFTYWYEKGRKWYIGISLFNRSEKQKRLWVTKYRVIFAERDVDKTIYLVKKETQKRFTLEGRDYAVFYFPLEEKTWVIFWEEGDLFEWRESLYSEIKINRKYFPELIRKGLLKEWKDASLGSFLGKIYGERLHQLSCYFLAREEKIGFSWLFMKDIVEKMPLLSSRLFTFFFVSSILFLAGYGIMRMKETFRKGGRNV